MQVPIEVVFEHVDASPAIEAMVQQESGKLERHFSRLTSCRVVLAQPNKKSHVHDPFEVRMHLTMPGQPDIVVHQGPSDGPDRDDPQAAIRKAFSAALKQIDARVSKMKDHHR